MLLFLVCKKRKGILKMLSWIWQERPLAWKTSKLQTLSRCIDWENLLKTSHQENLFWNSSQRGNVMIFTWEEKGLLSMTISPVMYTLTKIWRLSDQSYPMIIVENLWNKVNYIPAGRKVETLWSSWKLTSVPDQFSTTNSCEPKLTMRIELKVVTFMIEPSSDDIDTSSDEEF